jgi:hypothetical protein
LPPLRAEIDRALEEIYWEDLLSEGEVSNPSDEALDRLVHSAEVTTSLNKAAAGKDQQR